MVLVRGNMKADDYLQNLKDHLRQSGEEVFRGYYVSMQENTPIYQGHKVMSWLQENNINCMHWRARSPVLKSVESIWAITDQELGKNPPKRRTNGNSDAGDLEIPTFRNPSQGS